MAYLITGMVIMKVKYEKTGTDIIPNKQFWLALPFLIKVGDLCYLYFTFYIMYRMVSCLLFHHALML